MSVLPAGRSLARFLPDAEDLLRDPATYLAEAPVAIGPRRMYGLAALFGVGGAGVLLSCPLTGTWTGEKIAVGIGLLLAAAVWLGWSLRMHGHKLLLRPDGVEVHYRDTAVWCPWALFSAGGTAHVPDADNPRVGLILPVFAEAVPFVELRRNDAPVAHGVAVRSPQFRLTGPAEVMLPARYEVEAGDVGFLLLTLGQRLGHTLPKGAPPPEAYGVAEAEAVSEVPDPAGWVTVPLTRLRFPPRCCDCGTPTHAAESFQVDTGSGRLLGPVAPGMGGALVLDVPVCPECQAAARQRLREGGARGMRVGALALLLVTTGVVLATGRGAGGMLFVLGLAATAVGGLAGFLLGTALARRPPVQFRHYSPKKGTVAFRFRNPDYAALVLEATRARRPADGGR